MNVPDLGELRQLPDRWETHIGSVHDSADSQRVLVTIDAPADGPTEQQLQLIRDFETDDSDVGSLVEEQDHEPLLAVIHKRSDALSNHNRGTVRIGPDAVGHDRRIGHP